MTLSMVIWVIKWISKPGSLEGEKRRHYYEVVMWMLRESVEDTRGLLLSFCWSTSCWLGDGEISLPLMWRSGSVPFLHHLANHLLSPLWQQFFLPQEKHTMSDCPKLLCIRWPLCRWKNLSFYRMTLVHTFWN